MPCFLSCKSKSVLAKPLEHQCSVATISPGLGSNSARISPPQVPYSKLFLLQAALWTGATLRGSALRVQCRTIGYSNLPLHPLSKGLRLCFFGEHRSVSAECDVAGTKSRVLCGYRRQRKTALAKILPKLWIVTCDGDGGFARGYNYQGWHSRR